MFALFVSARPPLSRIRRSLFGPTASTFHPDSHPPKHKHIKTTEGKQPTGFTRTVFQLRGVSFPPPHDTETLFESPIEVIQFIYIDRAKITIVMRVPASEI